MSGDTRSPRRLARELAERPGVVPVLVTLLDAGGIAERERLRGACSPADADDAIRWLMAVSLVKCHGGAAGHDLDGPGQAYELTDLGWSLTSSLTMLADMYAAGPRAGEPEATEKRAR